MFDRDGKLLRKFDGKGTASQLSGPLALAVNSADDWIVADNTGSRVCVFAADGRAITAFSLSEPPRAVCVDGANRILVGDLRVQVFAFSSSPIVASSVHSAKTTVATTSAPAASTSDVDWITTIKAATPGDFPDDDY